MMTARLLRTGDVKGHDVAHSRRGFYRFIDAGYTWMLTWSMRGRLIVAILAIAVIASSVPLYKMVRQEFIPSDVDEGEFQVSITGREGTSLPSMDAAMLAIEQDVKDMRGVRLILAGSGGGFIGGVNTGQGYVPIGAHQERNLC